MNEQSRRTLWTSGMPTPGLKQHWRHEGGNYYVDVTDRYVPAPDEQAIERAAKYLCTVSFSSLPDCGGDRKDIARAVLAAALEQPE